MSVSMLEQDQKVTSFRQHLQGLPTHRVPKPPSNKKINFNNPKSSRIRKPYFPKSKRYLPSPFASLSLSLSLAISLSLSFFFSLLSQEMLKLSRFSESIRAFEPNRPSVVENFNISLVLSIFFSIFKFYCGLGDILGKMSPKQRGNFNIQKKP